MTRGPGSRLAQWLVLLCNDRVTVFARVLHGFKVKPSFGEDKKVSCMNICTGTRLQQLLVFLYLLVQDYLRNDFYHFRSAIPSRSSVPHASKASLTLSLPQGSPIDE